MPTMNQTKSINFISLWLLMICDEKRFTELILFSRSDYCRSTIICYWNTLPEIWDVRAWEDKTFYEPHASRSGWTTLRLTYDALVTDHVWTWLVAHASAKISTLHMIYKESEYHRTLPSLQFARVWIINYAEIRPDIGIVRCRLPSLALVRYTC